MNDKSLHFPYRLLYLLNISGCWAFLCFSLNYNLKFFSSPKNMVCPIYIVCGLRQKYCILDSWWRKDVQSYMQLQKWLAYYICKWIAYLGYKVGRLMMRWVGGQQHSSATEKVSRLQIIGGWNLFYPSWWGISTKFVTINVHKVISSIFIPMIHKLCTLFFLQCCETWIIVDWHQYNRTCCCQGSGRTGTEQRSSIFGCTSLRRC